MSGAGAGWTAALDLLGDPADLDVVDLGCGTGRFARWAAAGSAASVLGLDLAVERLAEARERGEPDGVRFEQADLEQLRLSHASYDLAFCAGALRHVADPLRLARTVNAGLRPGGRLVLLTTTAAGSVFLEAARRARLDVRRVLEPADGVLVAVAEKRPPGPWGPPGPAGADDGAARGGSPGLA